MRTNRPIRHSGLLLLIVGALAPVPAADGDPAQTRQLLAQLQADQPLHERVRACQQLAIIGTPDAVPALAALLDDATLGHYAREAIEAMADPTADAALRAALATTRGPRLVGVVNSVGARRDTAAVPALKRLAGDAGSGAAAEALLALGRIATAEAVTTLRQALTHGHDELRPAAAEGCLLAAQAWVAAGRRDEAAALCDVVRTAPVSEQLRLSAARGAILARGRAGLPLLLEQLRAADPAMREMALGVARELDAPDTVPALVAELGRLPPDVQALVIAAVVDRGDPRALPAIETRAADGSGEVRVAALTALGKIGRGPSVAVLLRAAASRDPAEASAALDSLGRIDAPEATAAILAALPAAGPETRAGLIAVLGRRGAEAATPEMLRLATQPDVETAKAAWRALALLARPRDLPELIRLSVACADEAVKVLAEQAVVAVTMRISEPARRTEAVRGAFQQAKDGDVRSSLLRMLGAIVRATGGDPATLTVVAAALHDTQPPVREAAVRGLVDWPEAGGLPALLEFIERGTPSPARTQALRGVVRLAGGAGANRLLPPLNAFACLDRVNRAVRTTEEKRIVIPALGSLKRIESLRWLRAHFDDPAVQTETARAVLQLAPALVDSPRAGEVAAVLAHLAATAADPDVRQKAAQAAREFSPKPAAR